MSLIWLIPLLPGFGAALIGVAGIRFFSKRASGLVACTTMGLAFAISVWAFVGLLGLPPDARAYDVVVAAWIPPIPLETVHGVGAFEVPWGFRLDPLSWVGVRIPEAGLTGSVRHACNFGVVMPLPSPRVATRIRCVGGCPFGGQGRGGAGAGAHGIGTGWSARGGAE